MARKVAEQDLPKFSNSMMAASNYQAGSMGLSGVRSVDLVGMSPTTYTADNTGNLMGMPGAGVGIGTPYLAEKVPEDPIADLPTAHRAFIQKFGLATEREKRHPILKAQAEVIPERKDNEMPGTRLVRIYVVDAHPSVPLAERVLYKTDEKMTDSTDQELFFEIAPDVTVALAKHNEKRVTYTEKAGADPEKAKKLEPARVRDLTISIIKIADF